jgi:hypothetical protein
MLFGGGMTRWLNVSRSNKLFFGKQEKDIKSRETFFIVWPCSVQFVLQAS